MYGWVEGKSWSLLSYSNRDWCTNLQWNFWFRSIASWLYKIPEAQENFRSHTSNLPLARCTWTGLFLAYCPRKLSCANLQTATYTMNMITLPSSILPTQFTGHFRREHPCFVYFRHQVYFLFFCPQCSTSAAEVTDAKGVFKLISDRISFNFTFELTGKTNNTPENGNPKPGEIRKEKLDLHMLLEKLMPYELIRSNQNLLYKNCKSILCKVRDKTVYPITVCIKLAVDDI